MFDLADYFGMVKHALEIAGRDPTTFYQVGSQRVKHKLPAI
jgi:hypothetical protein